uniref:Pyrroline-5-carboxylate reductase catalytic N-terminal domain-containing protein n=1 Tax=Trypanosoma congolense (strain IL3000) TaxID=1068625 RepID=G0UQ18_TRYCI|nr:conserved hypothetical protein [Trypanosoma congolense IL3000]
MQEDVQHLLCGVIDNSCVDPSLDVLVTGAPFAVSAIAQQCLYTCYGVSAAHALLGDKSSLFWHVMCCVKNARDKYVEAEAPPPPPALTLRSARQYETDGSGELVVIRTEDEVTKDISMKVGETASETISGVKRPPCFSLSWPPTQETQLIQKKLLSPLEFRVVVVGGGRVGRAVVDLLLRAHGLVHPSRITIITRRVEAVAQFASCGVKCVGKDAGRQALSQCHVLIIACQRGQFHDFVKSYCPQSSTATGAQSTRGDGDSDSPEDETTHGAGRRYHRHTQKRTLRHVVDKWRTTELSELPEGDARPSAATGRLHSHKREELTKLLRPDTIVFSCCVALPISKIARDIGHLYPLVIRARVDLRAVHTKAQEAQLTKDAMQEDFAKYLELQDNSFLKRLLQVQNNCDDQNRTSECSRPESTHHTARGKLALAEIQNNLCNGSHALPRLGSGSEPAGKDQDLLFPPPNNRWGPRAADVTAHGSDHSGNPLFIVQMWRSLRSLAVVQALKFSRTEQRTFTYLEQVGPLLVCVLVALPTNTQISVVSTVESYLNSVLEYFNSEETFSSNHEREISPPIQFKVNQRVVAAFDSDDETDALSPTNVVPALQPFLERELRRLVACFPTLFASTEDVLQQLLDVYRVVASPGVSQ